MSFNAAAQATGGGSRPVHNLGDILVDVGVITQDQYQKALAAGGGQERDLSKWLVELGFSTEEKIMKGIGIKAKVPYFTSLEGLYTSDSSSIISEELARRLQVVPLFRIDNVATVAMVNPLDVFTIDSLVKTTGYRIDPVVCMRATIFEAISKLYGGLEGQGLSANGATSSETPPTPTMSNTTEENHAPAGGPPAGIIPPPPKRQGADEMEMSRLLQDLKNKMPDS